MFCVHIRRSRFVVAVAVFFVCFFVSEVLCPRQKELKFRKLLESEQDERTCECLREESYYRLHFRGAVPVDFTDF